MSAVEIQGEGYVRAKETDMLGRRVALGWMFTECGPFLSRCESSRIPVERLVPGNRSRSWLGSAFFLGVGCLHRLLIIYRSIP